jgi:hypothetical protein
MADFKRILEGFFRRRGIYGDDRKSLLEAFRNAGTKLTGTLNKAVSGIAGNGGNLAEWDSDGNLVDSGHKFKANEHIDHSNVSIQPGDGLGGGGDLTFNRPINLRIESAPDLSSPESADELILSDTSAVGQFNPYAPKKADVGSVLGIYDSKTATLTNKTIDGNSNTLQNFATQNLTWATNMDGQGLDFLNGGDPDKATQSSPNIASVVQSVFSNPQGQLKLVIQHEGNLSSSPVDIEVFVNQGTSGVQSFTLSSGAAGYGGDCTILTFNQNFNDKDTLAFRTKSPNNGNASNMGRTIINAYIY